MSGVDNLLFEITPELLLKAYACGIFPMAESADDKNVFWVEPEKRGILHLNQFHIPKSLKKAIKKSQFIFKIDHDFTSVITACAQETNTRKSTWINEQILKVYCDLHKQESAHSFEVYEGQELVGGLYGVRLGSVFFGESMFSRRTNASKMAFVHLVSQMKKCGFKLLDTQFHTEHLAQFGVSEVPKEEYIKLLEEALQTEAFFDQDSDDQVGGGKSDSILQSLSQMS